MTAARMRIRLPVRVLLYTTDQLAAILNISEDDLLARYLYFQEFSTGLQGKRMLARNIEIDDGKDARWRVAETELLRYLSGKGFIIERDMM